MSISKLKRKRVRGKADRRVRARQRRHSRILKKVRGTAERPRLVVRRTLRHIEAQLIDDDLGICITGVSTRSKEVQSKIEEDRRKAVQSRIAGELMAERAKARGIERVVFDRGGYLYHGRVQAFAEGAREGGLKI
ncbi:MAG: 50S ribosomal protein L18 [Gemmatimonadetes bacterium]|nr:50S ribosomal protein L18 [Gemmatimonadota bacterium]NIO30337.1 50S ribosomal protein L18 [Gemmatimonadota bacterium]